MKIGIALDAWKLSIFHRHLTKHGFAYTKCSGLTADTLLLQVEVDAVDALHEVLKSANQEAAAARAGRN